MAEAIPEKTFRLQKQLQQTKHPIPKTGEKAKAHMGASSKKSK